MDYRQFLEDLKASANRPARTPEEREYQDRLRAVLDAFQGRPQGFPARAFWIFLLAGIAAIAIIWYLL